MPRVNRIIGRAIAAALLLALPSLLPSQAWADDWEDCRSSDTAKSVAGCGALIERGGLSDPQLGEAYSRRAMALRQRNQLDDAFADITKALELTPNNSMAYTARGSITIQTAQHGTQITIAVCDTGPGIPEVFGMNFQAVSVGQKLAKDNFDNSCVDDNDPSINQQPGGYADGAGTPSQVLAYGLQKTDEALASMIQALKSQGIYDSTLFIVTAKHGQSPINPVKINKPGHFADLVAALPDAGTNPAGIAIANANACSTGSCGFVQDDDIALIWLQGQNIGTQQVADYLNNNANALFIEEVLGGAELKLKFNDPAKDSRTPDIIVQPVYGTIYTGSKTKNAEHGGFSFGDTNVGLIVSNPHLSARVVKTPVATSQVAPTILRALDIDPEQLKSVRVEHTQALPGLPEWIAN